MAIRRVAIRECDRGSAQPAQAGCMPERDGTDAPRSASSLRPLVLAASRAEDVPFAVELRDGDPVNDLSQACEAGDLRRGCRDGGVRLVGGSLGGDVAFDGE